jgi:hypothetical protein
VATSTSTAAPVETVAGIVVTPTPIGQAIEREPVLGLPGTGSGMPGGGAASAGGVVVLVGLTLAFLGMAAGLGRRLG